MRDYGFVVGHGVKHNMKITSAASAHILREASKGSQRSSSGGWRKRNESTSITIPQNAQTCQK